MVDDPDVSVVPMTPASPTADSVFDLESPKKADSVFDLDSPKKADSVFDAESPKKETEPAINITGFEEKPCEDAPKTIIEENHWWPSRKTLEKDGIVADDPLASEDGQELLRKWNAMKAARLGHTQGVDVELNIMEKEIDQDISEQTISGFGNACEHGWLSGGGVHRHQLFARRLAAIDQRRASSVWIERLFQPNPTLVEDLMSPEPSNDAVTELSIMMSIFPKATEEQVKRELQVAAARGIYVDARALLENEEKPLWQADVQFRNEQEKFLGKPYRRIT